MREQELIVYKDFKEERRVLLKDMVFLMEHYDDEFYNASDLSGLMYENMHRLLELAGLLQVPKACACSHT